MSDATRDDEWVEVARGWTNIWDDIPINSTMVVGDPDKQWYEEHYRRFKEKFPNWEYRMFTTTHGPNDTDGTILQLWYEAEPGERFGVDEHFIWMEASDDAPFWLLGTFNPGTGSAYRRHIYTNSGVGEEE